MATKKRKGADVKITDWARMRVHLRLTTLLLILASSVVVFIGDKALQKYHALKVKNELLEAEKKQVETYISDNRGRMEALLNTIRRQDKDIRYLASSKSATDRRLFNLELAKQIYEYLRQQDGARPMSKTSVKDIQQYITACRDFENVFEKRYPRFDGKYSWKAMAKMLYIEHGFERNPPRGKADELGAPQIREFYLGEDGKRIPYLYNLLVRLGHKKHSYTETIDAYRSSPRIQVECMYEHFTRKLRDQHGDFIRSVVAYNSIRTFPEESLYWIKYQAITPKFNSWVEKASQTVEN